MPEQNTYKNCINYTPFKIMGIRQEKGYCDKIGVFMSNAYDTCEASTDDLGECAMVGENFGCIHFNNKPMIKE